MNNSFIKLDAKGKHLSLRARNWVAVLDESTSLIWSRDYVPGGRMAWKPACEAAAKVDLCGWHDWRAPTRVELLTLVDDTRCDPARDPKFFPAEQTLWEWTSTPAAFSPGDCAWYVNFYYGYSSYNFQTYDYYVRAVRASQSSLAVGRGKAKAQRR